MHFIQLGSFACSQTPCTRTSRPARGFILCIPYALKGNPKVCDFFTFSRDLHSAVRMIGISFPVVFLGVVCSIVVEV